MIKFPFLTLKKPSGKTVGIDIGNYNLKIVEIEKKSNSSMITAAIMKRINSPDELPKLIKDTLKQANISAKKANISVSGENVVARYLSLPKMSDDELKKAMVYTLEDHIPFKPEDVYTDFRILNQEKDDTTRMTVFLVATKKDLVNSRAKLILDAGLEPEVVTVDALALMQLFYNNYPDKEKTNIALLNIGDKFTNVLICQNHFPYFVRDAHFGGDIITNLIQTKLESDKKTAEELKFNLKNAPEDITQVIKSTFSNLLNEIFVSLDFYENLTERRIDEVYIMGGSSQLEGLNDFLRGYLGMGIFNFEMLKNVTVSPKISSSELKPILPYIGVALGLALETP